MDMPQCVAGWQTVAFIGGLMSDWGSIGGDIYTVPLSGGAPADVTPDYKGTFEGLDWRGNMLAGDRPDRRPQRGGNALDAKTKAKSAATGRHQSRSRAKPSTIRLP